MSANARWSFSAWRSISAPGSQYSLLPTQNIAWPHFISFFQGELWCTTSLVPVRQPIQVINCLKLSQYWMHLFMENKSICHLCTLWGFLFDILCFLEKMIPYFLQLRVRCCQSLAGTKLGFLELVAFTRHYEKNDKPAKTSDNLDTKPRNRHSMLNIARIANAVRVTIFSLFSQFLSNFSKRSFKIYFCLLVFDGC